MEFHGAVSKRIAHSKQRIKLISRIYFGRQQPALPGLPQQTAQTGNPSDDPSNLSLSASSSAPNA